MDMAAVLREKRKALGLTQEQVANHLGISAPAVNKWEKGSTCPDLLLLPALARLLKTDPNTLLGYQDGLSRQEVAEILHGIAKNIRSGDIEQSFAAAGEALREYPYCTELLQSTATMLSGALMMSALSETEKAPYRQKITAMYEQVAAGGDTALANRANYLLASSRIQEDRCTEAQALLDALPDWSALDKRGMQADVLDRQGKTGEAAALLERKLSQSIQDQQATLCRLIRLYVREGDEAGALALADCAQKECEAFDLGEYWAHIAPLEVAVARQDASATVEALGAILHAAAQPQTPFLSPLFRHLPQPKPPDRTALPLLAPLLRSVQEDPKYAFLADAPTFQALVQKYSPNGNSD